MDTATMCEEIAHRVGKVESVLDVGCDDGTLVRCLAERIAREALSIDIAGSTFSERWISVKTGFLNPRQIRFTPPGLHAKPDELERHLTRRLKQIKASCPVHKTIVIYGQKRYIDTEQSARRVDTILQELGLRIFRLEGDYRYDNKPDKDQRSEQ